MSWVDSQLVGQRSNQILNSVDVEINSTQEVFEALERIFRPESNQILVRFKFRNVMS